MSVHNWKIYCYTEKAWISQYDTPQPEGGSGPTVCPNNASHNVGGTPRVIYFVNYYDNLDATTDPGVNDDETGGYCEGSRWINTSTQETFICTKRTVGAAVWENVVGTSETQTITNKTIDGDNNTITNIDNANIKSGAAIDASKIANGSISNAEFQYLNGLTSDIQTQLNGKAATSHVHSASDITSGTFADARIAQSNVTQHEGAITIGNLSGAPTGAVVGTSDAQTLTNKTINADNNTITNIDNGDIKAAAAIDASKIANGSVSNTEFQYLDGLSSGIQTQLDNRIPYSEGNLIDLENGSPGSSNHVQFLMTKSHGGTDDYNLGVDSDPVKVIFSAEDGTYRQATVFSADTASLTATIFGVASSSNGGTNWNPRFVICQNGKIGVGTSTPATELDVSGDITVSGNVDGRNVSADGTSLDNHIAATSAHGTAGNVVGTSDSQTLTNKTITATSNNVAAKSLHSATTVVDVSAATAPSSGQVLTATGSTTATWQAPSVFGSEYQYAESEGLSSTTSTTFIEKVAFTTGSLPSGTYRIDYSSEVSSTAASLVEVEVSVSGTVVGLYNLENDNDYPSLSGFRDLSLSGVKTVSMKYRVNIGTETAHIRRARIAIQRVA